MNQDIKSLVETIVPQLEYLSDKQRRVIESAIALFSDGSFCDICTLRNFFSTRFIKPLFTK